jgi:ribosomal protein S3
LLKGNLKSNIQYTKSKSKTRIGSFGIKSWVSGD